MSAEILSLQLIHEAGFPQGRPSVTIAGMIHSHWEIENRLHWCLDVTFGEDANRLHWCLDVTFGEDANRTRKDHAPENLNFIRKMTMNILRLSPIKRSIVKKRLRASLSNDYLAEIKGLAS